MEALYAYWINWAKIMRMQSPKIKDVSAFLESWAPRSYQESYDNSGLLVGDPETPVKGVLVSLDATEAVIEEAIQRGCNLVVSHHPIIFKGLKSLTGRTYVERAVLSAIRNNVALYAIHTNLDNVRTGVNRRIAERLGLKNTQVLSPRRDTLSKLVTFVPSKEADSVRQALHAAGAGQIGNYQNCSFEIAGTGRFQPNERANPRMGEQGKAEQVDEVRIEVLLPTFRREEVLKALRSSHPYEEVAYYLTSLENENQEVGAGLIGELDSAKEPSAFLHHLKETLQTTLVRHTALPRRTISRVAVCGGAGSFLLGEAIRKGADAFVSADFKYHEFFDADGKILVCDVGHYESEQFTKALLQEVLRENFTTFASHFSNTVTNPISYF
jgi:dinuclear metal center YbgI/SA1388 family protein